MTKRERLLYISHTSCSRKGPRCATGSFSTSALFVHLLISYALLSISSCAHDHRLTHTMQVIEFDLSVYHLMINSSPTIIMLNFSHFLEI